MMSQKLNSLHDLPKLSNYENELVLFNFTYCLLECEISNTDYAKVFKKIVNDSKVTTKEFAKKLKIEYNTKILDRQIRKNWNFILDLYNGDISKFRLTILLEKVV